MGLVLTQLRRRNMWVVAKMFRDSIAENLNLQILTIHDESCYENAGSDPLEDGPDADGIYRIRLYITPCSAPPQEVKPTTVVHALSLPLVSLKNGNMEALIQVSVRAVETNEDSDEQTETEVATTTLDPAHADEVLMPIYP